MMDSDAIPVMGLGLITSLGRQVAENHEAVKGGKTGIRHLERGEGPPYLQYGAPSLDPVIPDMPKKIFSQMKFLNRGARLGFHAALEALGSLGADHGVPPERRALFVASGDHTQAGCEFMLPAIGDALAGSGPRELDQVKLNRSAMNKVNPFFLLDSLQNNLFSFLSAYCQFMGPNTSLASFSPGGGHALELAARSIRFGQADMALAVGYGSWINDISLYELHGLGLLSSCRGGASSYRPLDRGRDGFIAGEGGAAVLLMSREAAERASSQYPAALLQGCGNCSETASPHSIRVPDDVTVRVMQKTLEFCAMNPGDLGCVIPHGSGSRDGDRSELNSILKVLGESADRVPVWGLKAYTGHMGAASDLAEIILGIEAVREQRISGTLHFEQTEREFLPLRISPSAQQLRGSSFLSVSYGIGGQSSAAIVRVA